MTIAIISFLSLQLCPAQVVAKLFAQDQKGNVDSVIFGFNHISATLGIDSTLGEKNIFGQPWDSLDMRVIQRDSANHHCIRESFYFFPAPKLYFPQNIDSKIDFRKEGGIPFNTVNGNFEIFIRASHYPVSITGVINTRNWAFTGLFLLDSACRNIQTEGLSLFPRLLFTLPDSSFNTICVNFQHEVSIDDIIQIPRWTLYPNPASDKVVLEKEQPFDGQLAIISSMGDRVLLLPLKKEKRQEIDISGLPAGLFFLRYTERKGGRYSMRKLTIQH